MTLPSSRSARATAASNSCDEKPCSWPASSGSERCRKVSARRWSTRSARACAHQSRVALAHHEPVDPGRPRPLEQRQLLLRGEERRVASVRSRRPRTPSRRGGRRRPARSAGRPLVVPVDAVAARGSRRRGARSRCWCGWAASWSARVPSGRSGCSRPRASAGGGSASARGPSRRTALEPERVERDDQDLGRARRGRRRRSGAPDVRLRRRRRRRRPEQDARAPAGPRASRRVGAPSRLTLRDVASRRRALRAGWS